MDPGYELPQLKPHHLFQEVSLTVDPAEDELITHSYRRPVVAVKPLHYHHLGVEVTLTSPSPTHGWLHKEWGPASYPSEW